MKIKDAIDWIDIARMGYICDPNECGLEKGGDLCRVFHCDEIHDALVMAIEVLEKWIPKKHIGEGNIKYCGKCGKIIGTNIDIGKIKFCPFCGQHIDWSDTE